VQVLKYDDLLQALEMESVRQLEDLFIECMYQGIVKGKVRRSYLPGLQGSLSLRDLPRRMRRYTH